MNVRAVTNVVSALVGVIGGFILTAVPVSLFMGDEPVVAWELAGCGAVAVGFGLLGCYLTKGETSQLGAREGFGIVTFGWIIASAFGALPFMAIAHFTWYDAFFETMSGFTTTGASVLDSRLILSTGETLETGIRDLPKGLLYWRSTTHWLGGMGIVVLSLAILPFLGIGGQSLYNAEVPGPTSDQLTPRIASSAKILWAVYVLLSVLETILLMGGGMNLFDAWCHTCGTMATGGFSTRQASVGHYDSIYIDYVITLFMFLAGCNFVLHYRALLGKPLFYFKDEEFRFYGMIVLISILTVTVGLMTDLQTTATGETVPTAIVSTAGKEYSATFWNALRFSSFQVVSIITTTGFATADFDLWPTYGRLLLVCLMFVGGCGGSTGGGMKNSRFVLLIKYAVAQVKRCLFPSSISNVRLSNVRVETPTIHKVLTFFFLFVGLFVAFALVLTMLDPSGMMDFDTASTASIACLGNIGPGLTNVGATQSYSWMTPVSKLVLSLAMLLGRLELYTVLVVFLPSFWKK